MPPPSPLRVAVPEFLVEVVLVDGAGVIPLALVRHLCGVKFLPGLVPFAGIVADRVAICAVEAWVSHFPSCTFFPAPGGRAA